MYDTISYQSKSNCALAVKTTLLHSTLLQHILIQWIIALIHAMILVQLSENYSMTAEASKAFLKVQKRIFCWFKNCYPGGKNTIQIGGSFLLDQFPAQLKTSPLIHFVPLTFNGPHDCLAQCKKSYKYNPNPFYKCLHRFLVNILLRYQDRDNFPLLKPFLNKAKQRVIKTFCFLHKAPRVL